MTTGPVFFLTGAPGVGKSTVGRLLADRFERAFFLDLDAFRTLVVKGLSQPSAGWSEETTRQFDLAHRAAGQIAKLYSEAGFAVVVAHCSNPEMVALFLEACPHARVVCLRASLEVNLARNNTRTNKSFDPRDIEFFVHELWESLPVRFAEAGFLALDTTHQTPQQSMEKAFGLLRGDR